MSLESRIIGLEERAGQAEVLVISPTIDASQIVTGTIQIGQGGTGATTAAIARLSLQVPWTQAGGGVPAPYGSYQYGDVYLDTNTNGRVYIYRSDDSWVDMGPRVTSGSDDPNIAPVSGAVGDLYVETTTPALYYCTATDTWSATAGSSGTVVYRGRVELSSGTATVSVNPFDTVNDRIVLSPNDSNGSTPGGFVWAANFVADTSFDIISSVAGDKNAVDWFLIQGGDVSPSSV